MNGDSGYFDSDTDAQYNDMTAFAKMTAGAGTGLAAGSALGSGLGSQMSAALAESNTFNAPEGGYPYPSGKR